MDNERKIRELRKKIDELSEMFEERFEQVLQTKKNRRAQDVDFSIYNTGVEGFGNEKFYERIVSYGIDVSNNDELKEMARSLKNVEKLLEAQLKDIRKTRKREDFEEIAYEIQSALSSSTMMQRLPPEELQKRIDSLKYEPGISRKVYIERLKNELEQVRYERDSARGKIIVNNDPDLKAIYDDLLDKDHILNRELEYRNEHKAVTREYNVLCETYQTLEKIDVLFAQPGLSDEKRKLLEQKRDGLLNTVYGYLPDNVTDRIFDENLQLTVSNREMMRALKEEIQDIAFEKNALNGIVDDNARRKDTFDIMKVDIFENIEEATDWNRLQEKRKQMPFAFKNPEVQEFADKLELKLLMQQLMSIYQKEGTLKDLRSQLDELRNKPMEQLTDDERQKIQNLYKEIREIQSEVNNISSISNKIRELGGSLDIECIVNGSLDLNSRTAITTVGIPQVDMAMKRQKELAQCRKDRIFERYDIKEGATQEEIIEQMGSRINQILMNKRDIIIGIEPKEGKDVNAPSDTSSKENSSSVVPLNFDKEAPSKVPLTSFKDDMDLDDEPAEEFPPEEQRVLRKMKIYDTQTQIDTIDDRYKQRVELGKVYRYERGNDSQELLFVEEDLETYLEDPKKKLNEVLNGLRNRMLNELGSEEDLEAFCQNGAGNKSFEGLVSKNPLKRMSAKRKFIKELEKANIGNKGMAYANMAIALNSEVLPEAVDKVLDRMAQPYIRESDMKKYVKMGEKSGLLGVTHREQGKIYKSKLIETQRNSDYKKEKYSSRLNVRTEKDGMVRPFEITMEEMGTFQVTQEKPNKAQNPRRNNNSHGKNKSKKRDNKSQDGEIE